MYLVEELGFLPGEVTSRPRTWVSRKDRSGDGHFLAQAFPGDHYCSVSGTCFVRSPFEFLLQA